MKNLQLSSLLVLFIPFIVILSGCEPAPDFKKLEQEILDLQTHSIELFSKKDVEMLVNRFTEDGSVKVSGAPLVSGHEALRENYKQVVSLPDFKIQLDAKKIEISKSGDMAYVISEYKVSFNLPDKQVTDNGITVLVLKRVNDEWKIAAENLSSYPTE